MPNIEITEVTEEETDPPPDCEWCNTPIDKDDYELENYHANNDGLVCNDCAGDEGYFCTDCGELIHVDTIFVIGQDGDGVCESCYSDNYFYCEGCDASWTNHVYGGDGYCEVCYSEHDEDEYDCTCEECQEYDGGRPDGVRRWGDRPDLLFWHKKPQPATGYVYNYNPMPNSYYMGMEIELEESARIVGAEMNGTVLDHMWATTDASLDTGDGVEIVTMPHTFDAWMNEFDWEWWTEKIHGKVPDQTEYDANGIHIHVSRTAFFNRKGKMKASHLYKFMQFIQVNAKGIQHLAGRDGNTYCKWGAERDAKSRLTDAKAATSTRNYERYRPINTMNDDTIELRFFAGLSDPSFMKRSIMFVHSLVEFTRHNTFKDDRSWEAYAKYVKRYAMRYPDLAHFMHKDSRVLMVKAVSSEYEYKDNVLPILKADKARLANDARRERERVRERAQRQGTATVDNVCSCGYCEQDRRLQAQAGTAATL